ncbi:MAG: hypothetical protein CMF48_00540 [Legionellales bacterium]|nr:hypothetical protein [Legionellales bacterium]|tara:strand:+ start:913 stop:1410 length:498 start_codon:yes stop_codon:yes gene_type:complete
MIHQAQRGFTLLEMVLVMILVGILSAVALPRLVTKDYESAFFKDGLINGLRYGEKIAVASRRDVGVIFEEGAYYMRLREDLDKDSGDFTYPILSPYPQERGQSFKIKIPKNVTFSGPDVNFYFDPTGRARSVLTDDLMPDEVIFFVDEYRINLVTETGFIYEDRS